MENWQYDLQVAKQTPDATAADPQPRWSGRTSLAERYNAELEHLLSTLPIIIRLENESARRVYLETVMKALMRTAYVQARAIQLSDKLTAVERQPKIDAVFEQTAATIQKITSWLRL
ncbi:MAG: hypothetical protein HY565_02765 [Candidatus Kerfeldbacteria bacterium]|nr:hypothetical protein [Candidatus Kerfeldbacteria bacterium]